MKVTPSCPTLCNPMDYTVHGILQARILEWVAFPFSRGSSQPRDRTHVSRTAGRSSPAEPQGKPKNTRVGSLSFLQGIFPTQESNRGFLHCRRILYQLSYESESEVTQSCSTLCNPMDCRLLCPWDFPGKSTGVGCHCLLQGIVPIQGLNPGVPHCRQTLLPSEPPRKSGKALNVHKGVAKELKGHKPNVIVIYIYIYGERIKLEQDTRTLMLYTIISTYFSIFCNNKTLIVCIIKNNLMTIQNPLLNKLSTHTQTQTHTTLSLN